MNLLKIRPVDMARAAEHLRPGEKGLVTDLRALLRYAQTGALDAAAAWERFFRAMLLLFAAPGRRDFDPMAAKLQTPDEAAAPDAARVVAVMRASRGRLSLKHAQRIAAADLAALCSVDPSLIRLRVREGLLHRVPVELSVTPSRSTRPGRNAPITAASALAELKRRQVPPFGAAP